MNPNESLKLTNAEIEAILAGCAYNMASYSMSFNKAKLLESGISKQASTPTPTQAVTPDITPDAEQGEADFGETGRAFANKRLGEILADLSTRCQKSIAAFTKNLPISVAVQQKLLTARKSPTGTVTLSFTPDEIAFVTESLRVYEAWEIDPATNFELIASVLATNGYETATANSAYRTKDEYDAVQTARDNYICLFAKVINYGRTMASGSNVGTQADNDQ